jgi:hypothetical protein
MSMSILGLSDAIFGATTTCRFADATLPQSLFCVVVAERFRSDKPFRVRQFEREIFSALDLTARLVHHSYKLLENHTAGD